MTAGLQLLYISLSVRLNGNICDHSLVHQEVPWVRSLHHLPGKEKSRSGCGTEQK